LSNDPPSAPIPNLPADGATIGSATPNLEVINAVDLDRDVLTYQFEVFTASDGSTPVAGASGVPEGQGGTTSWQIPDALSEGIEYVWRCRAMDDDLTGEWSAWSSFLISTYNGPPGPPEILYPYNGSEISSTQPEITLGEAEDPEGDALTYYVEVFPTADGDPATTQSSGALSADTDGKVRWTPPLPLEDNTEYRVQAMADDGAGTSDWASVDFFVNTTNDPPAAPTLQNPSDGSQVDEGDILFSVVNASDADRDPLTYTFLITLEDGTEVHRVAGVPEDSSGVTSVAIPSDTIGGPGTYLWTAFATDDEGLDGESAVPNLFQVGHSAASPTPLGDDDTTLPGDDDTAFPGDDDTTLPGDDDTAFPGDDDTSPPGDEDTPFPGDDDTSPPAAGDDQPAGSCDCSTRGQPRGTLGLVLAALTGLTWMGRRRNRTAR